MSEKEIWSYCSNCKRETRHKILFSKKLEDDYIDEIEIYQVVECNGCDNLSFRIEEHDLYEYEEDELGNTNYKITVLIFPNKLKNHSYLKDSYFLPEKIKDVYQQTILAFQGKSFLLTGVGFRAIIEAICIEEEIKGNNLEQKINNLAKNRLITDKESERLHSIRFLGNDSVHEMEIPQEHKLFLVLDILENLLKNLYIIDKQAKSVLDTIIKDFEEFKDLLWKCSEKMKLNEEKTIKEIIGKHIRRVNLDIESIEPSIIEGIEKDVIKFLKLGSVKVPNYDSVEKQYYFYTGIKYDDFPF